MIIWIKNINYGILSHNFNLLLSKIDLVSQMFDSLSQNRDFFNPIILTIKRKIQKFDVFSHNNYLQNNYYL